MSKTFSDIKVDDIIFNGNGILSQKNNTLVFNNGIDNIIRISDSFSIMFDPEKDVKQIHLEKNINHSLITSASELKNNTSCISINENGINLIGTYQLYGSVTFRSLNTSDILLSFLDSTLEKKIRTSALCGKTVKKEEVATLQTMGITKDFTTTINMVLQSNNETEIQVLDYNVILTKL